GRANTPGARQASGRQRSDDALVFVRYFAGGFSSLRGFEFRGLPPTAGSAESGCEEPDAPARESRDTLVDLQEPSTGSVVRNERNCDSPRPPTGFDDLLRGRAFRGAGQEFRREAAPDMVEGCKLGGDFQFLNSIEYQVPVRANDSIFLVAFV